MGKLGYKYKGAAGLSYSKLLNFHGCPRLFELNHVLNLSKHESKVSFSYGHAVAAGVQEWFKERNEDYAILACAMAYTHDWMDCGTQGDVRSKKTLGHAIAAVRSFIKACKKNFYGNLSHLSEFIVPKFIDPNTGKERYAVELEFVIELPDGYYYEGHIDLILYDPIQNKYYVIELKTTGANYVHDAMYGNSDQAIGYSIILDKIVAGNGLTSYAVEYLIYQSGKQEWHSRSFPKNAVDRFAWLHDLVRTTQIITFYMEGAESGFPFPKRGQNCYHYFPCTWYGKCNKSNETLIETHLVTTEEEQFVKSEPHFTFKYEELVNTQIELAADRNDMPSALFDSID